MYWFSKSMNQYADFKGRARRMEYWMFQLFTQLILFAIAIFAIIQGAPEHHSTFVTIIGMLYIAIILVPSLSVSVRRLHDVGISGWVLLIAVIPYLGGLVLLILFCVPGSKGPNKYGPDPMTEVDVEENPAIG